MLSRRRFLSTMGAAVAAAFVPLPSLALTPAVPAVVPAVMGQALRMGDMFTIAGVFSRNPITNQNTGHLQRFVVTADVEAGPFLPLETIFPPILTKGPYQNCVAPDDLVDLPVLGIPSSKVTPVLYGIDLSPRMMGF